MRTMVIAAWLFANGIAVHADEFQYDCNAFPEFEGWTRRDRPCPSERWLEDGFFVQRAEAEPCDDQDDFYDRSLKVLSGAIRLRTEWKVQTTGPREEIVEVAPAVLALGGTRGVLYHTTIARDQVRFISHIDHPIVFVDLEPDVPHVYRVDVYGEFWYEWSIDGKVHAAGAYGRPYPTADSEIVWGNRAASYPNTTWWDFIRLEVPKDPPPVAPEDIGGLRAVCRNGRIAAAVRSRLPQGTQLEITNQGVHRTMTLNARGKGRVRYLPEESRGQRTVLILNCPQVSQIVECG